MLIREIEQKDYKGLMTLYMQLHDNSMPEDSEEVCERWESILNDRNHHIVVAEIEGKIISSCVCVVIPNLTRQQRAYALIENVITDEEYRGQGIATKCLDYAKKIAMEEKCYKIMLLTGAKDCRTLNFYRNAGYNCEDKTGFIQWL